VEDRAFGSMPKGFPTLFANGDLPEITASGIAPEKLRAVPWQARPAVARAASTAEAFSLLEKYAGPDGETMAEIDAEPGGPLYDDVAEFEWHITEWATDPERTISELRRVWPDVDWSRSEAPRTRRLEQGSRAQASGGRDRA
jgi:hypothetical protein